MKPLILVVDMQNDFVQTNSPVSVRGLYSNLPRFKTFIDKSRIAGIQIGYTRHTFDARANAIEAQMNPAMTRASLERGKPGWNIVSELAPAPADLVLDKTRFDAFFNTNLHGLLKQRGIDTLIITGASTEIACESTARSAMYLDYRVQVISDLVFSSDPVRHEASLKVIGSHFGQIKTSGDIGGTLAKPEARETSLRSRWAGI